MEARIHQVWTLCNRSIVTDVQGHSLYFGTEVRCPYVHLVNMIKYHKSSGDDIEVICTVRYIALASTRQMPS